MKKWKLNNLIGNIISLFLVQGVTNLLPILTIPYLITILGINLYGSVVYLFSILAVLKVIIDFGFTLSGTHKISVNRDDKSETNKYYNSITQSKIYIGIIVVFVYVLFSILILNNHNHLIYLYLGGIIFMLGESYFPTWYFQGKENIKLMSIIFTVSRSLGFILLFVFIRKPTDFIYIPLVRGFPNIFGVFYAYYYIFTRHQEKFKWQTKNIIKREIKDSLSFFASRMASVGLLQGNTLFIGLIMPSTYVAIYDTASKVISFATSSFDPIIQALFPNMTYKYNTIIIKNVLKILMILSGLIVFLIFLSNNLLSVLFLKEENPLFLMVLRGLSITIPLSALYVLLGAPVLLAKGLKYEFNASIIYGSILQILLLGIIVIGKRQNFLTDEKNLLLWVVFSVVISKTILMFIRLYYVYSNKILRICR